MNLADVEQFLLLLGAKRISRDAATGWVRCSCPLAPWLHEHKSDRRPSFGIKIPDEEGRAPYFHCFSCGSSGLLPKLLHDLCLMTGDRMLEASDFLSQFVVFDEEEPPKKRRIKVADRYASDRLEKRKVLQNVPVPHETLEQYPLLSESNSYKAHADVLRWLVDVRKISLAAIRDFQLRLYIEPVLEEAGVIFPIISRLGPDVLDLWVRMIPQKRFFRLTRDFTGSRVDYRAPNLWFGNHLYTEGAPILLVEGALDALRLYSLGVKNVLASFGEPSTEQIASVYAPVVHLGYDSDESGRRFTKNLKKKLDAPSIHILDWSVVGLKDAGELEDVSQLRVVFDSRVKTNETRDGKSKEVPTSTKSKSKILRFHKKDDLIL